MAMTSRGRTSGRGASATPPTGTTHAGREGERKGAAPAAHDGRPEAAPGTGSPVVTLVDTAADGTRTYHDDMHCIAAVVGPAAAIRARWRKGYRDFDVYRAADRGLFMLLRFDLGIESLGPAIAPASGPDWTRIAAADLERLIDGEATQADRTDRPCRSRRASR